MAVTALGGIAYGLCTFRICAKLPAGDVKGDIQWCVWSPFYSC
jgi:hypothetical protein